MLHTVANTVGSLLAATLLSTRGLRTCMMAGALMNGIAGWLRYVSALDWLQQTWAPDWLAYSVLLTGQCIAALAQPIFTNAPTAISAEWFATEERDVATTIAALFNLIGNAAGQVLPPVFVNSQPGACGMAHLLLLQAGVATFGLLVTLCLYRDRPEGIFPSRVAQIRAREAARARQDNQRIATVHEDDIEGMSAALVEGSRLGVSEVVANWCLLLEDREFLKLMLGFGTGLAIFNSLMTVIQQIINPAGYSSDDAGSFGGILIGAGLVGAMIVGPLLDHTKAYKTVLKLGMPIGLVAVTLFVANLKPDNWTFVAVSIGSLGFVMLPMLPVSLETAAECTYPIPEDCSSALLMITGQLVGIPLIFGLDALIQERPKYDGEVWTPAAIFLVAAISVCVLFVWWFDGKMKRLASIQKKSFMLLVLCYID